MKPQSKSKDARRRARKLATKTTIKTGTKVIPDKRKAPQKHRKTFEEIYADTQLYY
jgi:hypothetical protein